MEMEKLWRGLEFLVPSYLEIQVSLSVAFIILFVYFLCLNFPSPEMNNSAARESEEEEGKRNEEIQKEVDENAKIGQYKEESRANSAFVIQVELLAARNLVAANINGTSDPYAIISCGEQKRFSSMVPGSRNPIWGEEFNFFVEDLPTELLIAIHDWDIVWKSNVLGSVTVPVGTETQAGQIWYELDSTGEVCLQIKTLKLPENSSRAFTNYAGANTRRRISLDGPGPTVVHQKPGPMQTIFDLPPDEIVEHSYSCALERSFLYHGRMYVSAWHICFHSNVFSKQIKVVIPFGDIDEIRKSQHAVINPAITIVLRTGAGGYGVPPLSSPDGRVKYMFASFWNRSHTIRILQKSAENYLAMRLAEKKELEQSAKRALSSSVRRPADYESIIPANIVGRNAKVQPFIKEEVLVSIVEDVFPCTAEQFFLSLLNDDSKFISEYRSQRQDTDLNMGQWHVAEEYDGQVRELKYRSICRSPMCPPYTAMTEWQHYVLSNEKSKLVFETVQQAHDVPFGSYFEIHCRWSIQTNSSSTCTLNIKVGAHFKKWCPMQSKIKNGAVDEYKKEVDEMLQVARLYLKKYGLLNTSNNEITSITIQV